MNPTAIEGHLVLVLVAWMVIIAAAFVFGRLGKMLGQPLAVGEILGGIVLGPSALGAVWPADWPTPFPHEIQQSLQLLGKVGIILLLFQVGMEFDYAHLRTRSRTVTVVSLLGIAVPFVCGLAIGPWLHREFAPNTPPFGFMFFLCIALSISALPVMGRILLEMKLERTAIGTMGISAAAVDDVIGWILLAVATALVTAKFRGWQLGVQIAGVLGFFLLLMKVVGPALRKLWVRMSAGQHGRMPHAYLVVLLLCLFASALATNRLGIFAIFGAFLLGVSLHQEVTLVKAWRDQFSALVLVAFVPIFFTNTGLNTNIGGLQTPVAWLGCALVLLMAVVGKLGGCYLGAKLTGQSTREAGCIAALMNTRGLMGLVAINVGLDLGLLSRELFTMLVLMALLTTAMCRPLLCWWLPKDLQAGLPKD